MDACPNCARTFIPDRLIVHLRSCNKAHGKAAEETKGSPSKAGFGGSGGGSSGMGGGSSAGRGGSMASPKKDTFVKPKTLVCYIW